MTLYQVVGDLATDLNRIGWTRTQLQRVCEQEAPAFNIAPRELMRKVEAAYLSRYLLEAAEKSD